MLYWQSFERIGFASDLELLGKHAQAVEQLQRALEVLENFANRDSAEVDFRSLMGRALHRRAAYALRAGDSPQAQKDLEKSEQTLANLFRQNPKNLEILNDLADGYREMGNFAAYSENWREAAANY